MIRGLPLLSGLGASGLVAAGVLWGCFNAWFYVGDNYRHALAPVVVPVSDWQMVEGQGKVHESGIHLEAPGTRGYALVAGALREPVESAWLDHLVVRFSQLGAYNELLIGVSNSSSLSDLHEASPQLTGDGVARLDASDLAFYDGEVGFVTLRVRGGLEPAMVVDRVELHRSQPGFIELQGLLISSLIHQGGWTQRSINQNQPDYTPLRILPVVVVLLWMAVFTGLAALILGRVRFHGRFWPVMMGLSLLIGWLLLDTVWQVSLWGRHFTAVSDYAGRPPDSKALNERDAELIEFVQLLRASLNEDDRALVVMAGDDFSRFRARYAALPHPSVSRTGVDDRLLRRVRPGDVLVAIDLSDRLKAHTVSPLPSTSSSEPRELPLELVAGRDAEVEECGVSNSDCSGSTLRLIDGERPWLMDVPWQNDLGDGVWQIKVDLTGGDRSGWVRLEVFRRSMGNSKRWAWREIYLAEAQPRLLSLAFRADEGADYRIRMRELDSRSVAVRDARLAPKIVDDDLVELSLDGDPPFFLARRVLESKGKSAWEML